MDEGVILVASGEKYIKESKQAIFSIRKFNKNINIALFTDDNLDNDVFFNKFNIKIIKMELNYNYYDKIIAMRNSPFRKTLFLDTDTYVLDKLKPVFQFLDRFDLCVSHAPIRKSPKKAANWGGYSNVETDIIPDKFPEFNTGVILYRKNKNINEFLNKWDHYFNESNKNHNIIPDQPSFRTAIYHSNVNFFVLPPEYNCRYIYPTYVSDKVKILHGRNPTPQRIKNKINKNIVPRIIYGGLIFDKGNIFIKIIKKILDNL